MPNNNLDYQPDYQPQNTDTTNTANSSSKQEIIADIYSSISGVLQAQSIINSTININVHNESNRSTELIKEQRTLKQGVINKYIVSVIIINGLQEVSEIKVVELLSKLHFSIRSFIDNQRFKEVITVSNLLGAKHNLLSQKYEGISQYLSYNPPWWYFERLLHPLYHFKACSFIMRLLYFLIFYHLLLILAFWLNINDPSVYLLHHYPFSLVTRRPL